jgi:hypothetical protein
MRAGRLISFPGITGIKIAAGRRAAARGVN